MGDRVGRKSTLVTTLLLMGNQHASSSAFCDVCGDRAFGRRLRVTLLRFLQGLGSAGEF